MKNRIAVAILSLALHCVVSTEVKRSALEETKQKKDLETDGTIIDPYLYGEPGLAHALPYGVAGPGLIGPGHMGPLYAPHPAPFYKAGTGYGGGFLRAGLNEGGLALGNQGQQLYHQQLGGGFDDGSYHKGGLLKQGGYGGGEIYNDNKNHLADTNYNKGFYNGVEGGRKNLGGGEIFDKNQKFAQNGLNQLNNEGYNGFQKGHKKTGFKKSYHKDESGNDESYYDSDHDEGNQGTGNKYGNYYDSNGYNALNNGIQNNQFTAHQRGQVGEEGLGKLIARNQGARDYYGGNNYYGNDNGYGQYGANGLSRFGKVGGQHGYLDGFNKGRNYESFKDDGYGRGSGFYGPGSYY